MVPAVNLGSWVVSVIVQDKQLFGGDFTLVSGTIVLLALHVLIALGTAFGVGVGKAIERRIAPRIDQY